MSDITIYIVAGIILLAFILLFAKMNKGIGTFNLKVFGITLVASLASILVLSDIPQTNLTAAFGILGTIIGYLFGIKSKKDS
jgi:uncharacterized membrane protein